MNTGPALVFPPSTEAQVEPGYVRAQRGPVLPGSGSGSIGETNRSQKSSTVASSSQDEVKMQLEPPGEIAVYQFVNQQGTLILQVPSEQILSLARQIAEELAVAAEPKPSAGSAAPGTGGKDSGH
jgi:hypothetical protein